ncbi:MAG TPA: 16S rRNA (guanine(966)-N(2))-methyltransferase RsmD [Allosphingosinicella sp.]|jgi:16S rRNA (guanine966-N2)-methyltransferase
MRIIAGAWRGRAIEAPAGTATRPTSDRAREGLFSMLTSRIGSFEDLAVADLFAGTGAAGLEALSRGAARCTFVETDRAALEALRRNVAKLGAEDRADVRALDATRFSGGPFHLVLLDPPYGSGLGGKAILNLIETGALAPGCLIALETGRAEEIVIEGVEHVAERNYGKARILLLRKTA